MPLRYSFQTTAHITVMLLALALVACGGAKSNTGQLTLGITDAPVDSAESVVIHVTAATLHSSDGDSTIDVVDPVSGNVGRNIDLLLLQSGQWAGLFDETVSAGHYSWIRLGLDLSKSYIQIAGEKYGLRCGSCDNVGYRINRSFDVTADATLALMLDFDLRKSITDPNGSSGDYILRPTVRLIESAASGSISGTVDPTLISSLISGSSTEPCSVYVFDGQNAQPNDVYLPMNGAVPDAHTNPISTAKISTDGSNNYTAAYLPAGDYTIVVTCDAVNDSTIVDDTLNFSTAQNVSVSASSTSTANFAAP